MRQFHTSVLERRREYAGTVESAPYEAGWASEAIYFVRIEKIPAKAVVELRVQISPDGMQWIDEGSALQPLDAEGDAFVKVSHFGGWLRLAGTIGTSEPPESASVTMTIHLALKE